MSQPTAPTARERAETCLPPTVGSAVIRKVEQAILAAETAVRAGRERFDAVRLSELISAVITVSDEEREWVATPGAQEAYAKTDAARAALTNYVSDIESERVALQAQVAALRGLLDETSVLIEYDPTQPRSLGHRIIVGIADTAASAEAYTARIREQALEEALRHVTFYQIDETGTEAVKRIRGWVEVLRSRVCS